MVIGVILAGGKSRRFRGNKLITNVEGVPIIRRVYDVLSELVDEIYLSIANENQMDIFNEVLRGFDVKYVLDNPPGRGVLNGIITSLENIPSNEYLFVPGDLPWMRASSLEKLMDIGKEHNSIISVPIWGNGCSEPLVIYFNKRLCGGFIRVLRWIEGAGRSTDLQRIVSKIVFVPVKYLSEDPKVFAHINVREDINNPSLRNPLEGPVNEAIILDRGLWSSVPYIRAMEALSHEDYISALRFLEEELSSYLKEYLMQLVKHVLRDMVVITSKCI